jgi:hypothetical protein
MKVISNYFDVAFQAGLSAISFLGLDERSESH